MGIIRKVEIPVLYACIIVLDPHPQQLAALAASVVASSLLRGRGDPR